MESIKLFQLLALETIEDLSVLEQLFYIPTSMLLSDYISPVYNGLVDPEGYNVVFKFFRNIFDYVITGGEFIKSGYYNYHTFKDTVGSDFGLMLEF